MHLWHGVIHPLFVLLAQHEFIAIFVLLTLEEAGVPLPVPGDTLIIFAGAHHALSWGYDLRVLLTSATAVFIGSSSLYWFVRRVGRAALEHYGRFVHLKPERIARMEAWFRRRGPIAIILGRLIPGLRMPTTLMAGISDVPYRVFAASTLVAAIIWTALYLWLGLVITRGLRVLAALIAGMPDAIADWLFIALMLALIIAVSGTWHWHRTRRRAPAPASE